MESPKHLFPEYSSIKIDVQEYRKEIIDVKKIQSTARPNAKLPIQHFMRGRLVKNQAPSRRSLGATELGLNNTQALPDMNMTEQFASQICNSAFVVQAYYPQNLN